jgi:hypothetical protein
VSWIGNVLCECQAGAFIDRSCCTGICDAVGKYSWLAGRDALSIYDFGQMFLSHELKALMNGCLLKALAILRLCCTGTGNVARHKGILVHRERKR